MSAPILQEQIGAFFDLEQQYKMLLDLQVDKSSGRGFGLRQVSTRRHDKAAGEGLEDIV